MTFKEFFPFYESQHTNPVCRRLHFIGTSLAIPIVLLGVFLGEWWLVLVALLQAYALAWIGHFFFEHNMPATFKHPWLSLKGDMKMWWQILTGKIKV